ncbi:hypothetical protein GCM10028862_20660 [Luteimonas pelagia]
MPDLPRLQSTARICRCNVGDQVAIDGATRASLERIDVDECACASSIGSDKPKSLLVIPINDAACEASCNCHGSESGKIEYQFPFGNAAGLAGETTSGDISPTGRIGQGGTLRVGSSDGSALPRYDPLVAAATAA